MNILAVDDEKMMLQSLVREVQKVFPEADIKSFGEGEGAIDAAKELAEEDEIITYAFLDIKLRGMSGIELAKEVKKYHPDTKIIFCTGYSEYAREAYGVYARGYLMKPVVSEDIVKTLDEMVIGWKEEADELSREIRIQTFGNFEVFVKDDLVVFEREKSKELLAYLVDRKGAAVTTAEIAAVLWEDKLYDRNTKNLVTTVVHSLRKALKQNKIEDILVKTWNHLAIDVNKIKCDVYDFEAGVASAVNSYRGEYMSNYSWAEFTNGRLEKLAGKLE